MESCYVYCLFLNIALNTTALIWVAHVIHFHCSIDSLCVNVWQFLVYYIVGAFFFFFFSKSFAVVTSDSVDPSAGSPGTCVRGWFYSMYPEAGLPDCRAWVCSIFLGDTKLVSHWLYPFVPLPPVYGSSHRSICNLWFDVIDITRAHQYFQFALSLMDNKADYTSPPEFIHRLVAWFAIASDNTGHFLDGSI